MSLAFLVPLFLLGIAGVVVPVLIHLTRRQRRNVVHFPSLMFLEKIPYQEQRRRRVQHWFLLSLRALALAVLAMAFARPFFQDDELGLGASGGPREVVVLIDQSYSMEIDDQLDQARDEAQQVFDDLGPLDRASLVSFSQGASVLARSTADRTRLRAALDTVQLSSGPTRFGPALKVAQTILEESNLPSGEVFLLSDFQRNGWVGDEGVRLPTGSTFTPIPLGDEEIEENILVTDISPPVAHDLLFESQIRGQLGISNNGEIIVSESTPRETLSPGIYDAMRRTLFILDIAEFVEVEELGRTIASIQAHVENQRLNASRSDFPILSSIRTDDPSATDKEGDTTVSGPAVLPMPRRGDREEEADTSQAETEMDNLVDELDEMDL